MTPTTQTHTAATTYLSEPTVLEIFRQKGLENCLSGMAVNIRSDFLRRNLFDKSRLFGAAFHARCSRTLKLGRED